MDRLQERDVPYGEDWDDAEDVARWVQAADRKRPWREGVRQHIAERVAELAPLGRVLELGSGPGLLAQRILEVCPRLRRYTLLDFSEPMLAESRRVLGGLSAVSFVRTSFKSSDWVTKVDHVYDVVVSMQAIHELRNKRHAGALYEQARQILVAGGTVLICDHTPPDESPKSTALYMTTHEQLDTLARAGFRNGRVTQLLNGLAVYQADTSA